VNRRSQQSKPTFAALLLVMALGACTVINEHKAPPSDWPQLEVIVEEHGFWGTQEKCGRNVAEVVLIGPMLACAWINFDEMTCRIYLWLTSALGHELLHCKGYDHYISNSLADYWNEWKQSQRVAEK
jgi:hypothetical protein